MGSGQRPRTKRVKVDCTLSADYYHINKLKYFILYYYKKYGEPSQLKPETELAIYFVYLFKAALYWLIRAMQSAWCHIILQSKHMNTINNMIFSITPTIRFLDFANA